MGVHLQLKKGFEARALSVRLDPPLYIGHIKSQYAQYLKAAVARLMALVWFYVGIAGDIATVIC